MTHHYRLFGMEVASDLPLATAPVGGGGADLRITARTDAAPPPKTGVEALGTVAVVMTIAGVARYRIQPPGHIHVDCAPDADPAEVELFLLGTAIGMLLHGRGLLTLHANALAYGPDAIAVAGPSGAGKSTLAAHLNAAGLALLSDDVCAVDFNESRGPLALPGVSRLRLSREALEPLLCAGDLAAPLFEQNGKQVVKVETAPSAARLRAVYGLAYADGAQKAGFERLRGAAAVELLMRNSYRGDYLSLTGSAARHFHCCVALARTAPVFLWRRRWGLVHAHEGLEALLAHARREAGFGEIPESLSRCRRSPCE